MNDDATPSTRIVHSKTEVEQVTSSENDFKVRTFHINWDAPQDEQALYSAVGGWFTDMRKEHGYNFRLESVYGDGMRVQVTYFISPARERLSVVAQDDVVAA